MLKPEQLQFFYQNQEITENLGSATAQEFHRRRMPFQIDPEPGENEIECGNCGAIIYAGLSRCPECGVNLYEPEVDGGIARRPENSPHPGLFARLMDALRRLSGKPYFAEEVFGDSLDQAVLFNDLLGRVGGDRSVVERLIDFERQQAPQASRSSLLHNAIQRWERDNRVEGSGD
jgi:hypothetical protein